MLEIVIATRNRHKFRELRQLLALRGIRYRSLAAYSNVPTPKETGCTFEANAMMKARFVAQRTQCVALADDSGLEVDALKGAPGVRSARFAGAHGDDAANNRKLLRLLNNVPESKRGAGYRCALALASPERVLAVTRGAWRGRIARRAVGRGGFGYDPLFLVPRLRKTVGQLPARVKQRMSHRAQAARRLQRRLQRVVQRSDSRNP